MLMEGCSLTKEAVAIHGESILDKLIGSVELSKERGGRMGQFFRIWLYLWQYLHLTLGQCANM